MKNEPIAENLYQVVINLPKGGDVYKVTSDFVSEDNKIWIKTHFKRNLDGVDLPLHLVNTERTKFIEDILKTGTSTDIWQGSRKKEAERIF